MIYIILYKERGNYYPYVILDGRLVIADKLEEAEMYAEDLKTNEKLDTMVASINLI